VRAANTQPQYDFLTGGDGNASVPQVGRSREATENEKPRVASHEEDRVISDLKAEVKTLRYTLNTREQEQELARLRQESEVRDVRRKGEEDFKKMQMAEGERNKAVRLYEELLKELQEVRDRAVQEKALLEKRARAAEEERRVATEEIEEREVEEREKIRTLEREKNELEAKNKALARTIEEIRGDSERKDTALQEMQQRLVQKELEIGELESEVLRLKAQTGDVDTLGVIKRELSEQVAHIRALEATNREHLAELKHFRRLHKSIEIVEEEKRALQRKVDAMNDLEQELGEARLQRQRLEDERLSWTAYLQSQARGNGDPEFNSPEAIARALVKERLEAAALLEKLGEHSSELAEKESIIKGLEVEKARLEAQVEKLKSSGCGDSKTRMRLERQRALAIKEVEYLRAQLKTFDAEESTMELQSYDEQKVKIIQQLEDMVDQYRSEVQTLHDELAAAQVNGPAPSTGTKRPRDESEESEYLGQLSRKNRKLQDDLSATQISASLLQKELAVAKEQLSALSTHRQTRILSLRSNPTFDYEAIKTETLAKLKAENAALISQLQTGKAGTATVPVASLEAAQRDVRDMAKEVASKEKKMERLKSIWGAKSMEFREGINSLLGWKVDFMPNGKMKVTSLFYPSTEDNENSIVFDGENGAFPPNRTEIHISFPNSLFFFKTSLNKSTEGNCMRI
jgi:mitotic spindle assembly checkpoint protein MAD1